MNQKHVRDFKKKLADEFPGIEIAPLRSRNHFVFELKYNGMTKHVALSNSPGCAEIAVAASMRIVRHSFNSKGTDV